MSVRLYDDLTNLPASLTRLFDAARDAQWQAGIDWHRLLAAHASDPHEHPMIAALESEGAPRAALALYRRPATRLIAGAWEWASLANFYSCLYAPAAEAGDREHVSALALALTGLTPSPDAIDFNSLAEESPLSTALEEGLRRGGFVVRRYFHFANWYEPVGGLGYADYLKTRPGALRSTIERRTRQFTGEGGALEILAGAIDHHAIAAYDAVYRRSWKGHEPYAEFMPALLRMAGAAGVLRLGLARWRGEPIAAQIWLVHGGRATIFKLAHDERHAARSAGTVLTAHVMAHVLDRDRVDEVDFGRGDDAYKRQWLNCRRVRHGLLAINKRRWRGWFAIARHVVVPQLVGAIRG